MKVCKICGSNYDDRVDFCFRDGTPLGKPEVVATPPAAAAPPPAAPSAPDAGVEVPPAARANPLPFGVMTSLPGPGRRGAPVVRRELTDLPTPGGPDMELPDPEPETDADTSDGADLPPEPAGLPPAAQHAEPATADAQDAVTLPSQALSIEDEPTVEATPRQAAAAIPDDEDLEPPTELSLPASVAVDLADLLSPSPSTPPSNDDTVPIPHPKKVAEELEEPGPTPLAALVPPPAVSSSEPAPPGHPVAIEEAVTQRVAPTPPPHAAPTLEPEPEFDGEVEEAPRKSRTLLFLGIAVLFVGVGVAAVLGTRGAPVDEDAGEVVASTRAEPAAPAPVEVAPPTEPTEAAPTEIAPTEATTADPAVAAVANAPSAPATPVATSPAAVPPTATTARTAATPPASADRPTATARVATPTSATPATADADDPWGSGASTSAPAAQVGRVSVVSTPAGARILLDDKAVGTTPLELEMSYGLHMLRVELAGHRTLSRTVQVAAAAVTVPFELPPIVSTGQINLFGPTGAEVYLDNRLLGKLPATSQVDEGVHTFRVVTVEGTSFTQVQDVRFSAPGQAAVISLTGP